jgi:hypothetical protein
MLARQGTAKQRPRCSAPRKQTLRTQVVWGLATYRSSWGPRRKEPCAVPEPTCLECANITRTGQLAVQDGGGGIPSFMSRDSPGLSPEPCCITQCAERTRTHMLDTGDVSYSPMPYGSTRWQGLLYPLGLTVSMLVCIEHEGPCITTATTDNVHRYCWC